MSQRRSFRASGWEPLEDRNLLSTATVTVVPPSFPNLSYYLQQFDSLEAQVIGKPTPVVSVTPNGFIDNRVTLSRTDVSMLVTAVNTFYTADKSGMNLAAVANFKASLTSLDQFIATEPQHVTGGGTVYISGATTHFILPLLNGAPPTASDVNALHTDVDNFAASYTYGAKPAQDTVALNELESQLSLLILSHSEGF